jgi:hypothetical protein
MAASCVSRGKVRWNAVLVPTPLTFWDLLRPSTIAAQQGMSYPI